MAAAPWYLEQKAGLKHQKAWNAVDKKEGEGASGSWYKRGVKTFQATKFRKGACENCGAMTHKRKDCVERPRAVGANKSHKNIAADELVQDDVRLGFEQKRDRYNGFDASEYSRVVDKFERAEKLKEEAAKKRELEKRSRVRHPRMRKRRATARRTRPTPGGRRRRRRFGRFGFGFRARRRAGRAGVHEGEQTRAHGGWRGVDDGAQPADPRGHRQVPPKLGSRICVLRSQDEIHARESQPAGGGPLRTVLRRG